MSGVDFEYYINQKVAEWGKEKVITTLQQKHKGLVSLINTDKKIGIRTNDFIFKQEEILKQQISRLEK